MLGRVLTAGLVCFLFGTGLVMFLGPWLNPESGEELPGCPYLEANGVSGLPLSLLPTIGAYKAIRETLQRDSIDGIGPQAEVIARAFAESNRKLASLAKRLAAEQDVESARRAFRRLHRLMEKDARKLQQRKT